MSCTLSHECRVMLIAELLTASTDATRGWLRAEMDRTVDPMLDSIFNRLKTKLTNVHVPSTSSHFNSQFVNMNYSYQQQQQNGPNHFNSNFYPKLSSQSQPMTIKEEIEPMPTTQAFSYPPVSNEQSNYNLTDQNWNNDEDENSQIDLPDTEMQPQPPQIAHIKHNQFDDDECDCDECVNGGIEVKVKDQVDEESSQPVKRPRMDTSQPNNPIHIMEEDDCEHGDGRQTIKDDHHQAMNTQIELHSPSMNTNHGRHNSDESKGIQQEESYATNEIGDASASECISNPIQLNLAQPNRHLQCSQCHKSFDFRSTLQRHLRVHTGERPFHCDQCDKQFIQQSHLTQHQLIHQNIKRYRCDQCDKQFSQKNNLEYHQRTHSGERPYQCRFCDKTFREFAARTKHEQAIHLHVKPYRCKQCGHTATQQSTMITHIRVVHFGLPQTIKQQRALNIIDDRDPKELMEKV